MPKPDPLQEFRELSKPRYARCGIELALEALPPAEAATLKAALKEPEITHASISKWLAKRNIKVASGTVSRHRLGNCNG